MVTFPGCKINLGLHVLSKRPDGYHAINTCFFRLPWTDVLEILPSTETAFHQSGLTIPGDSKDNLCYKAFLALRQDFQLPPIQLHLHKLIPTGAGLGGGSADAAHTLLTLNSLFALAIPQPQLIAYAQRLGSDCAFFAQDQTAIGRGRGEILEPVNISLDGHYLVLIKPEIFMPTAEAYAGVTPRTHDLDIRALVKQPIAQWMDNLKNDFELSVFGKYPVLAGIKEKLNSLGALYSSMSGSGSSLYGIFDKEIDRERHFNGLSGWSGWL